MALCAPRHSSCQPGGDTGWPRLQRTQPWGEPGVLHTDPRAGLLGWVQVMGGPAGVSPTPGLGSTITSQPRGSPRSCCPSQGRQEPNTGLRTLLLHRAHSLWNPPASPPNASTVPSSPGLLLPDPGLLLPGRRDGALGLGPAQPPLQGAHSCAGPTACPGPSPGLPHPPAAPASAPRGRKKAAGGGTWGFISFYPSTFEKIIVQVSTRERRGDVAGAARPLFLYLQGTPEKKRGKMENPGTFTTSPTQHHQNVKNRAEKRV